MQDIQTKNKKILLVEDETIVMLIHNRLLKEAGYSADTAENGQQAIALSENNYDLIFMDIGLPDISGIEVTAEIRKRERENNRKPTNIVALTGFNLEEVQEQCNAVGIEEILSKPLTVMELQRVLEKFLGVDNIAQ